MDDGDDDKLPTIAYVLTPKASVDKGMGLNSLNELIKKELQEYFDGRDNLTAGDDEDVNSDGNIMEMISDEDLDKAARIIKSKMPRGESDISSDVPGYKYGAYSFEAWDEVRDAMTAIGRDPEPESAGEEVFYETISNFVNLLKTKKLIYLEW